eukprot:GILJ01001655.1.p1 GENE.GILJ01001655.1~~GILJ01001655.1.p1  ORF type:complete len:214 (+),score=14.92 GILJ01001655.1:184-825(+)
MTDVQVGIPEFKVIVLGASGVGKTSLVIRYVNGKFPHSAPATVGASFLPKKVFLDDRQINLQIWDTAGQERFQSMVPLYYRGAAAAVVVCDVSSEESIHKMKTWFAELRRHVGDSIVLAIACNKMDTSEEPMASERFAHIVEYAHSSNVPLFRTSAKFNQGIEEMFHDVSQRVLYNYLARKKIENSEKIIRPTAGSSGVCPGCSDGRAVWGCC